MTTYIVLGKLTQEGISKIKEAPKRWEAAQKVAKSLGGEIKEIYYTLGQYDFVAISEAPSNEAIMKAMFIIGSAGAVKTETLVAIPTKKVAEIIKEMP